MGELKNKIDILKIGAISNLFIPLLPLELQKKFVYCIEERETQIEIIEHGLAKMEENYRALMQEYFG